MINLSGKLREGPGEERPNGCVCEGRNEYDVAADVDLEQLCSGCGSRVEPMYESRLGAG
jgi:hypothetical protein